MCDMLDYLGVASPRPSVIGSHELLKTDESRQEAKIIKHSKQKREAGRVETRSDPLALDDGAAATKHSERAYMLLRNQIVRLELRPGSALNERELVERFSLGRTPIREALLRLASDRLVDIGSSRGMSVAPISFEDVNDIYEVRLQEDRLAARLCLAIADDAAIEGICECFGPADELIKAERFNDVFELDFHFHRMIYDAANNPFLSRQHDLLRGHYHRLAWLAAGRRAHMGTKSGMQQLVRSHDSIIAALRDRSVDKLDRAVTEHVSASFNNIVAILSQKRFDQASALAMVRLNEGGPEVGVIGQGRR